METKYYTPSIEEFHVGFEFETKNTSGVWTKNICETSYSDQHYICIPIPEDDYNYDDKNTRVKHLDREDIESLGWIFNHKVIINDEGSSYVDSWVINIDRTENKEKYFQLYLNDGKCYISYIEYANSVGCYESDIFQGTLKNKSELKRIMKQSNIEIP